MKIIEQITNQFKLNIVKSNLKSFTKPYKLHIGCGSVKFSGWLHIDYCQIAEVTDIVWDVTKGIPFIANNSCYLIYNEHFLEHLSIEQGCYFLSECYRALELGGVLRIATPSLAYIIEKYTSDNWRDQEWLNWKEYEFIQTRAEMLNIAMRWWGHQWVYDREELHRRLKEAGFTVVKDVEWGEGDILELRSLETRKDSILICEAYKS